MGSVQVLWSRRELVSTLATSEFKGRYRRMGLGVAWSVLNPLIQGLLIALVFHFVVRYDVGFPYALFILAGLVPWNFFVTALVSGTDSLLASGAIVQRVALPRAALPTATLLTNVMNLGFMLLALVVIVGALAFARLAHIWLLPLAVILEVGLVYGLTLFTAPLQVRYRDVGQVIQAVTLALFWATPIVYPLAVFEELPWLQTIVRLNPLTGVVAAYRSAVLALPLDGVAVLAAVGWTTAILLLGWRTFARREPTVADFI